MNRSDSPLASRQRSPGLTLLRWLAIAAAAVYVGWNLYWLAQGRIPPAIFYALTGLPAPTTGGVRAIQALARGEWSLSWQYNAMALPLTALFAFSVLLPVMRWATGRPASLPRWIVPAWIVLLLIAWVFKLTSDSVYW